MSMSAVEIWTVIVLLGLGTFLIRFSFLGLVGSRPLPSLLLRLLRFTPVAVLPGLVAPLVLWPAATGGATDPARLVAAGATLAIGLFARNTLYAIIGGALTLYAMLWLPG